MLEGTLFILFSFVLVVVQQLWWTHARRVEREHKHRRWGDQENPSGYNSFSLLHSFYLIVYSHRLHIHCLHSFIPCILNFHKFTIYSIIATWFMHSFPIFSSLHPSIHKTYIHSFPLCPSPSVSSWAHEPYHTPATKRE